MLCLLNKTLLSKNRFFQIDPWHLQILGSRSLTSSARWAEKQFKLYAWAVWRVTWGPDNHKHRCSYTASCSAHPGTPMNRLKTCFSLGWSEKSSQLGLMIEVKIKLNSTRKGRLSAKKIHIRELEKLHVIVYLQIWGWTNGLEFISYALRGFNVGRMVFSQYQVPWGKY